MKVEGIFMMQTPLYWEVNLQILLDVLSTTDGNVAQKMPQTSIPG